MPDLIRSHPAPGEHAGNWPQSLNKHLVDIGLIIDGRVYPTARRNSRRCWPKTHHPRPVDDAIRIRPPAAGSLEAQSRGAGLAFGCFVSDAAWPSRGRCRLFQRVPVSACIHPGVPRGLLPRSYRILVGIKARLWHPAAFRNSRSPRPVVHLSDVRIRHRRAVDLPPTRPPWDGRSGSACATSTILTVLDQSCAGRGRACVGARRAQRRPASCDS